MARGFNATLGVSTSDVIKGQTYTSPTVLSFAGWYNRRGATGSGTDAIWDKTGSAVTEQQLSYRQTASNIRLTIKFSTTAGAWTISDADALASGRWNHIVVVYDGGSTANVPVIYINGRSVTVTTLTAPVGTVSVSSGVMTIGNRSTGSNSFDGILGDQAFWHNKLLTAAEAVALYQGADPRNIQRPYLFEHIIMSEGFPYSSIKARQPITTGTKPRADRLATMPARAFPFAKVGGVAYNVTITVTRATSVSLKNGVGLVRAVTNAPSANLARAASLARQIAASAASSVSLATLKAKGVQISVTQSPSVTQLRAVGLVRSITAGSSASLARAAALGRAIAVSAASAMTMTRAKALQATISVTRATSVTLATLKAKGVLISVTNSPAVSLTMLRAFGRSISVAGSTTVSILRPASLKRTLNFTSAVSALLSWLRPEAGIGASRILRIPAEIRRLIVKPEVRTLAIEPENRTVAVKSEKN